MGLQKLFPTILTLAYLITGGNSLTIDNQLVIIANDCYTRIAIGSILPSKDIATSVMAATVTECEDECSRKRNTCEIFSFGISSKGNATCLLGTRIPNPEELAQNSDYDIYIRQQSSPNCMPDRLYKLGSGDRNPSNYNNDHPRETETEMEDRRKDQNETSRSKPKPGRRPITVAIPNAEKIPADANRPNYYNYPSYQVVEEIPNFSPGYPLPPETIIDEDNPNPPFAYGNKNPNGIVGTGYGPGNHKVQGNPNFNHGYESDYDGDFYNEEHQLGDGNQGDYYYSHSMVESGNQYGINIYEAPDTFSCYRKLFAGKRLAEIHIRRAIVCEQIEECSRECDSEKGFSCEGFNYRHQGVRGPPSRGRPTQGLCELTSMPPSEIDISRDTLQEPRYDYYERESGCQNRRPSRPPLHTQHQSSGWLNVRPSPSVSRPQEEVPPYLQRPIEIPRPLQLPDRRPHLPIDIPRPNFAPDYLPDRRYHGETGNSGAPLRPWRPDDSYRRRVIPGINIRPIEDDVRYEYFRPERPDPQGDRRRPPDHWYRPQHHDSGLNEIDNYKPGRRKDSVHGWGSGYGSIYGGSYGYNTNYIESYDPPKREKPLIHREKRPFVNHDESGYDDVYNYGGAFGYNENYVPDNRDAFYSDSRRRDDCSVRAGAGFKLRRGIIRKSYLTPTLDQCENLCAVEKDCLCRTFSYRYSLASNAPTDNCLLSEISYRDLDFYTDLEPDRDYDIYSMTGDPKYCRKEKPINQRPPEECFWRVRSGCGVPPDIVRRAIVAQGLGDCEAECVEARSFTCRSFVYRYGDVRIPSSDGPANCFLSDWPSQEIDPLSLPELDGAELYQRGSFGRGCEPTPFPPLNHHKNRPEPDNRPMNKDEVCYAEYQKPCRLTPEAVIVTIYVDSEYKCRERCSEMRERDPESPCMSFSYRISNDREEHNCFMSDVPRRDLRPGIDYVHGDGHLLFAWKEFEPRCDSGYSIGIFIDDDRDLGPKRPSTSYDQNPGIHSTHFKPPFENEERPVRPHGNRYPPPPPLDFGDHRPGERPFSHGGYGLNSRPSNDDGFDYPSRPINPDRPDPVGHGFGDGGSSYENDDRFGHGYSDNRYNDFSYRYGGSTFQHFTVNGRPCKRGTRCERNKVAGFWSCEPEGSEFGTWDYCCEPKHHCGYSQGYHYPWCYVGPYEDQWRPCSDKYYPYIQGPRPVRPSSDRYDENESYGEVPRPGMLGRHWPVAYLHREAPPNATDSLAAADSRRNRELQNVAININNTGSLSYSAQVRGNYIIKNSGLAEDRVGSDLQPESSRRGKIERISRFGESRSRKSAGLTIGRNSTSQSRNDSENRQEIDEILEIRDLIDGRDSAGNFEANRTTSGSISSNWRGTTFIRLPTISPNQTTGGTKFEDYFEVVNVE